MSARRSKGPAAGGPGLTDALSFALECQEVIGRRMLRLAGGGHAAAREAERMVSEKLAVAARAQFAAFIALPFGLEVAGSRAAAEYRRAVRANLRRLGRKG
jgi:hypothetical protein